MQVRAEAAGERVRVSVEDHGIGIAPQHQERVFRAFERLHGIEAFPGTGMGLAIVRKGVERLGGHVGLESTEGRGSRFWVDLPRFGGGMTAAESTILLVEDNPTDVLLIQRAFAKTKLANPLQIVGDGDSAVDYLSGGQRLRRSGTIPFTRSDRLPLKLLVARGSKCWHGCGNAKR